MTVADLQSQCELGQQQLMRTEYLAAEATLAEAEKHAWAGRDWDTLSRLYMPLQEARRQKRQRCGEGVVCLDLWAEGELDELSAQHIIENYPHGQLLVAGWCSIEPAKQVRRLAGEHEMYLETLLGAVYPMGARRVVAIVPKEDVSVPAEPPASVDALITALPAHSIVLAEGELPSGIRRGDASTFSLVMGLWERLHSPFVAAARMQRDAVLKIEACRKAIAVDYACEPAHQEASEAARRLVQSGG